LSWPRAPLATVAPAEPSPYRLAPDEEVWHLTLDQIESGTGRIIDVKLASASEAGTSTFAFDSHNVLYSKLRPYLNKVVRPHTAGIATTELVPLRPRLGVLLPDFLAYYLRSPSFLAFASSCTAGTKMPRVIMTKFWEHEVPLPPLSEQRRIVKILDQADHLRRLRADADAKVDRILPALFIKMFGDPVTNPMGWPVRTLGELAILGPEYGANARATPLSPGQPRYVRITDIDDDGSLRPLGAVGIDLDEWEQYKLEEGDLLFARSGATVGKTYLHRSENGPSVFAGYLIRFRLDPAELHPLVAFGFTHTMAYRAWVGAKRRTAAQPNINGQEYASLRLPVPARSVQEYFASLCSNIEMCRRAWSCSSGRLESLFSVLVRRAFDGDLTASWREAHMEDLLQEMEHQAEALAAAARPE